MENLTVTNRTAVDKITQFDVTPNGDSRSCNIMPGATSDPMPLHPGLYGITVTLTDPNGQQRIVKKQVAISDKNENVIIDLSDSEPDEIIRPNLIY
jgi:hypothetical protein